MLQNICASGLWQLSLLTQLPAGVLATTEACSGYPSPGTGQGPCPPCVTGGTEAFQEGGWDAPGVAYIGIG